MLQLAQVSDTSVKALFKGELITNFDNAAPSCGILRLCANNTAKNRQANGLQRDCLHVEPDLQCLIKRRRKKKTFNHFRGTGGDFRQGEEIASCAVMQASKDAS